MYLSFLVGLTKVFIDIHNKHSKTLISLIKQRQKEKNRERRNKKKKHKNTVDTWKSIFKQFFYCFNKKNLLKENYMQFKKYLHYIITDKPVSAVMVSG